MKKILLGTTALVTAGLLAGPALASDPLKVTVGGNVVTGFYFVDADNIGSTNFQDTKVALVARNIDIKAEGTLDNGLVAGVDAKLQLGSDWNANNVANGSANFRQLFAYLEGGFGKFEIGGTDGAAYKMHYTSPRFVPGNGVDSPNIMNSPLSQHIVGGLRQSTFSLLASDANKISYFTPRLAGFQLGLSYTPDANGRTPKENGLTLATKDAFIRDVYEVALNYAGTFSGIDLGADGFYVEGRSDNPAYESVLAEYGFGANLGYGDFTLGGAFFHQDNAWGASWPNWSDADGSADVWTLGVKYVTGPWTMGVAYLDSEQDHYDVRFSTKTWQVGGGYNLGAGVDLGLDLQFNRVDDGGWYYQGSKDTKTAGLVLAVAL